MLKSCFNLLRFICFLRTSTCFIHRAFTSVIQSVKCELRRFFEYSVGSARCDGWSWGFIRIFISTSRSLVSAFGASDFFLDHVLGSLRRCFIHLSAWQMSESDNEKESPLDGTQETWTHSVDAKNAQIWFPELMTNVRKFLTLIKVNSGLSVSTLFLVRI